MFEIIINYVGKNNTHKEEIQKLTIDKKDQIETMINLAHEHLTYGFMLMSDDVLKALDNTHRLRSFKNK